jgi:hypothetical protein
VEATRIDAEPIEKVVPGANRQICSEPQLSELAIKIEGPGGLLSGIGVRPRRVVVADGQYGNS